MTSTPGDAVPFRIGGAPVVIATQMPDVSPGATPVAYGNWKQAYMVVNRKGVTMQQDPYSAGFCILFKMEARIGGTVICPQAVACCALAARSLISWPRAGVRLARSEAPAPC